MLTVEGQLLRGSLGGQLQPLQDVTAGRVSCIAWSADGSLLALASASCVTVQHLESGRHFRTEFDSKVLTEHLLKSENFVFNIVLHGRYLSTYASLLAHRAEEICSQLISLASFFHIQEARDADGVVNVDTLAWLGSKSLLVSANLHPVEDLTTEMVRSNCHSSLCTMLMRNP